MYIQEMYIHFTHCARCIYIFRSENVSTIKKYRKLEFGREKENTTWKGLKTGKGGSRKQIMSFFLLHPFKDLLFYVYGFFPMCKSVHTSS